MGHVDTSGRCVLVHAAQRGHLQVLRFLLRHTDWNCTTCCSQRGVSRSQAVQQALIAAASKGHTEVSHTETQKHTHLKLNIVILYEFFVTSFIVLLV